MINQILMAAARGARTQSQFHNWSNGGQDWRECPPDIATRIHPDDEHLRFGPISSTVREVANTYDNTLKSLCGMMAEAAAVWFDEPDKIISQEHRAFFCLILSEALADEGL